MDWQGVDTWVMLAVAVWLVASLLLGLGLGLLHPQEGQSWLVNVAAGVLVPFAAFVAYLVQIVVMLAVAVLLWVGLARAFPAVEASRARLVLLLGLYSLLAGALVWEFFPLDRNLAPAGAALTALSIWLPRFITAKLAAGSVGRRKPIPPSSNDSISSG
jgi:hypothetical protein